MYKLCTKLYCVLLLGTAAHAATVVPENPEAARTQFEHALIVRQTLRENTAAVQREFLRQKAAQEDAMMAIRNTVPERGPEGTPMFKDETVDIDRTYRLMYAGGMVALVAALAGMVLVVTRRFNAAREKEMGNNFSHRRATAIIAAPRPSVRIQEMAAVRENSNGSSHKNPTVVIAPPRPSAHIEHTAAMREHFATKQQILDEIARAEPRPQFQEPEEFYNENSEDF